MDFASAGVDLESIVMSLKIGFWCLKKDFNVVEERR